MEYPFEYFEQEDNYLTKKENKIFCDTCDRELKSGDKYQQEFISGSVKCMKCILEDLNEVE